MKKSHVTLVIGLVVGAVVGSYFAYDIGFERGGSDNDPEEENQNTTDIATYENADLGLSFAYRQEPDGYVLIEPTDLPYEDAEKAINLFRRDEWEEFEGSEEPREGPPGMSLLVFEANDLTAEEWIESHEASNYVLGGNLIVEHTVGGIDGVEYNWSGLYEGRSVVILHNDRIYLFSVTYLERNDGHLDDFETLLDSVVFLN